MLDNIATLQQLELESQQIQDYLEITCSEDPEECVSRGLDLSVYMARSAKMLADAKYHQDKAVMDCIVKELGLNISPSVMNKLITAACRRENYLVNWIDRLNRTITHQGDFLRTVISKAKEEIRQNQPIG